MYNNLNYGGDMHYLIYKITNLINGTVYVGAHKTSNINDGYMGSGKRIKRAIAKYGINNFKKEILYEFSSAEEMYAKEFEIVTEEFLKGNVYNLKIGGEGGWDHICNSPNFASICSSGVRESNLRRDYSKVSQKVSESMKIQWENGTRKPTFGFLGKLHNKETKKKISDSAKINSSGKRNSQFGTMWIHSLDEKVSKRIKKTDPIPEGWFKGRKMKF